MEKEKKMRARWRFNIVDAILILLALLCIVGVWQRKNLQALFESGETLEEYTVTFEVKQLRSTTADLLAKGVALYITDGGTEIPLGILAENAASTAATVYLPNEDGEMTEAVYPQDEYDYRLDVKGKLTCHGVERDGRFLLEGKCALAVNQILTAHTEKVDIEIRITSIEKVQ